MAKKKNKPKPQDGWSDPWKYIQAAPNTAFSPQYQAAAPPPPPPPAPVPQPPPPDPAWEAWLAQVPALQGNVYAQFGNPALLNDPNASLQDRYGYEGVNLLSNLGLTESGQIDPTNPYGQASLLQQAYQQGQAGTSAGMSARGQGYSGITQSLLDSGTDRYNQDFAGLGRSLSQGLQGITQEATGRLTDIGTMNVDRIGQHSSFNLAYTPEPYQPPAPAAPTIGQSLFAQHQARPSAAPGGARYVPQNQQASANAQRRSDSTLAQQQRQQDRYRRRRRR